MVDCFVAIVFLNTLLETSGLNIQKLKKYSHIFLFKLMIPLKPFKFISE